MAKTELESLSLPLPPDQPRIFNVAVSSISDDTIEAEGRINKNPVPRDKPDSCPVYKMSIVRKTGEITLHDEVRANPIAPKRFGMQLGIEDPRINPDGGDDDMGCSNVYKNGQIWVFPRYKETLIMTEGNNPQGKGTCPREFDVAYSPARDRQVVVLVPKEEFDSNPKAIKVDLNKYPQLAFNRPFPDNLKAIGLTGFNKKLDNDGFGVFHGYSEDVVVRYRIYMAQKENGRMRFADKPFLTGDILDNLIQEAGIPQTKREPVPGKDAIYSDSVNVVDKGKTIVVIPSRHDADSFILEASYKSALDHYNDGNVPFDSIVKLSLSPDSLQKIA